MKHLGPALAVLLLQPIPGRRCAAQVNPGTHLVVDITVALVTMNGDTTHVRYVLFNRAQSQESLFTFTVSAPAPVISILAPGTRTQWTAGTVWASRSVASWGALENLVIPGTSTPPLEFSARGLPGIDTAWYGGNYPLSSTHEDDPDTTKYVDVPDFDPLDSNNVRTKTVGIDYIAIGTTGSALIVRLGGLRGQACSLGWITAATLCSSLQANLDSAARDLQNGRNATAKSDLRSFNHLLDANHGLESSTVRDNAYWLLKVNADYLIRKL